MRTRSYRLRQLAVAALGAVTAVSGIAVLGAAPAGAAVTPAVTAVTAVSSPTVFPGVAKQTAGNWGFSMANTFNALDTLTINLPTCVSATNYVEFAGVPKVTVTPVTGQTTPTFTATLGQQSTLVPQCAGINDKLTLTVTNTATGTTATPFNVSISGVTYTLGSGFVTFGPLATSGTYASGLGPVNGFAPAPVTVASNATVAAYSITGNSPAVGLAPSANGQAISNVVITEFTPGTVTGTETVTLDHGATFTAGSTPKVTASGGGAVVGPVTGVGTGTLSFTVTTASTAPATFTLSGLSVDTSTTVGPLSVTVAGTAAGTVQVAAVTSISRIFGQTAVDTSAALFEQNGCNSTAVLATSDNYPDALSASYLAQSTALIRPYGSSVLITPTKAVDPATLTALRLEGVSNVLVVGGPLAISPADIATLQSTPAYNCGGTSLQFGLTGAPRLNVTQIYGQTQYGTAQQVAQYVAASKVGAFSVPGAYGGMYNNTTGSNGTAPANVPAGSLKTAILAVGTNYPDAMAASALSYRESLPILLTQTGSLAPQAEGAIINLGIQQVIVMGGPQAISDNVLTQLMALGVSTFRIAGTDYTDTAQLLAQFELNNTNTATPALTDGMNWMPTNNTLVVSRGDDFQDALSASAYAGRGEMPILLTEDPNTVGTYLTSFLNAAGSSAGIDGKNFYALSILGGPLAVTPSAVTAMSNAFSG